MDVSFYLSVLLLVIKLRHIMGKVYRMDQQTNMNQFKYDLILSQMWGQIKETYHLSWTYHYI